MGMKAVITNKKVRIELIVKRMAYKESDNMVWIIDHRNVYHGFDLDDGYKVSIITEIV